MEALVRSFPQSWGENRPYHSKLPVFVDIFFEKQARPDCANSMQSAPFGLPFALARKVYPGTPFYLSIQGGGRGSTTPWTRDGPKIDLRGIKRLGRSNGQRSNGPKGQKGSKPGSKIKNDEPSTFHNLHTCKPCKPTLPDSHVLFPWLGPVLHACLEELQSRLTRLRLRSAPSGKRRRRATHDPNKAHPSCWKHGPWKRVL